MWHHTSSICYSEWLEDGFEWIVYQKDQSFHVVPREGESEDFMTVMIVSRLGEDGRPLSGEPVQFVVDKRKHRLAVEDVHADDENVRRLFTDPTGPFVRLRVVPKD